jgi:hypothetical protein
MEFRNLKNNFLFLLANRYLRSGSLGPYQAELIYEKFSDIRDENISADLESLQADGFVAMSPDRDRIYLTKRGVSQVEFLISTEK